MAAGVAAAPCSHYGVPAMRMPLDFVVYVGMVAALSYLVLFHSTARSMVRDEGIVDHSFTFAEGTCALVFITVSISRTYCCVDLQ